MENNTPEVRKLCPLRMADYYAHMQIADSKCQREACAWWDAENARCAVLALAQGKTAAAG